MPAGNDRLVPDVSLAADPNDGAFLVFNGKPIQIGGTSWSAPTWAGLCALLNEARQNAGKSALPFLNPMIDPLMGTRCFRDIVDGSNGAYHAGPGYDMVTGIGVPSTKDLIAKLVEAASIAAVAMPTRKSRKRELDPYADAALLGARPAKVGTGFAKRTCSNKELQRITIRRQSHPAVACC
jgi:subtilase family serine protease